MSNKEYTKIEKKFRVWDGKSMWYRGSIQFDMMPFDLSKYTFFEFEGVESSEIVVGNAITVFEIMQWIGKIDINKKMIFEGDILKFKEHSSNGFIYGQVVFNNDDCQFEIKNLQRWTYSDKSFSYSQHEFCRTYEMEVIGNIYETPKIIEQHDLKQKENVRK